MLQYKKEKNVLQQDGTSVFFFHNDTSKKNQNIRASDTLFLHSLSLCNELDTTKFLPFLDEQYNQPGVKLETKERLSVGRCGEVSKPVKKKNDRCTNHIM